MKKLLAMFCALMMLTSFASCGGTSQNNSELSDSISEIENVKYETDYFSFEYPSNWEIEKDSSSYGTMESLSIHSDNVDVLFNYSISKFSKKLTTNELRKEWEEDASSLKDDAKYHSLYEGKYKNYEITDDFVKNGQAYILVTNSVNNSKYIKFQADGLSGNISLYSDGAEEAVMTILETLEFY